MGLPHPYQDCYPVTSIMRAVKRSKSDAPAYKLSLTLGQIREMRAHLDVDCLADAQVWNMINLCFYGLLRISSVTVPSKGDWDPTKILTRGDIRFVSKGCILSFRHTKTIQFQERTFEAVIPQLPDTTYCPALSLRSFLHRAGNLPDTAPALAYRGADSRLSVLTPPGARDRLKQLFIALNLPTHDYNTHSLRRSGATHLLAAGVPVEIIKIIGDWKSDCIFKYLTPNPSSKLLMLKNKF